MQQTFNDLYNERQTEQGWFGRALWIFIETSIGILLEHILLLKEMNPMNNILTNIKLPTIISFLIVLPFMILEWAIRSNLPRSNASGILFVIMWILPMLFLLTAMPIMRDIRAGNSILANPVILLVRVVFSACLAWMWFGLVVDQMPCFLGATGC